MVKQKVLFEFDEDCEKLIALRNGIFVGKQVLVVEIGSSTKMPRRTEPERQFSR